MGNILRLILRRIELYLSGEMRVEELETWLIARLQLFLDCGDKKIRELVNEMDADFMELHEGLIDEKELYNRLRALHQASHVPGYATGADSLTLTLDWDGEPTS